MKKKLILFTISIKLFCIDNNIYDINKIKDASNIIPIAIIGGGIAGLSAGIYASRAKINTVVFAGPTPGGQLVNTTIVENVPGIKKTFGYEIVGIMTEQAEEFGATVIDETIIKLELDRWPFVLHTKNDDQINALTVIIATGSTPRKLGIEGELEYWGKGVAACALCECVFFKDKEVYIVGDTEKSLQQALLLAAYAKTVNIILTNPKKDCSPNLKQNITDYSNIKILNNKKVVKIIGDGIILTNLELLDTLTGNKEIVEAQGIFIAIGNNPNSELFKNTGLELDNTGYIKRNCNSQETNIPGVFVAGDVSSSKYKQTVIASASGATAALESLTFLIEKGFTPPEATKLNVKYFQVN